MRSPELVEYIKGRLGAGISPKDIHSGLLANGWAGADVDEAFVAIDHSTETPAPIEPKSISPQSLVAPVWRRVNMRTSAYIFWPVLYILSPVLWSIFVGEKGIASYLADGYLGLAYTEFGTLIGGIPSLLSAPGWYFAGVPLAVVCLIQVMQFRRWEGVMVGSVLSFFIVIVFGALYVENSIFDWDMVGTLPFWIFGFIWTVGIFNAIYSFNKTTTSFVALLLVPLFVFSSVIPIGILIFKDGTIEVTIHEGGASSDLQINTVILTNVNEGSRAEIILNELRITGVELGDEHVCVPANNSIGEKWYSPGISYNNTDDGATYSGPDYNCAGEFLSLNYTVSAELLYVRNFFFIKKTSPVIFWSNDIGSNLWIGRNYRKFYPIRQGGIGVSVKTTAPVARKDAEVKMLFDGILPAVTLFLKSIENSGTYGYGVETTSCSTQGSLFAYPAVAQIISEVRQAASEPFVACLSDNGSPEKGFATSWAISVPVGNGYFWCVDDSGNNELNSIALSNNNVSCASQGNRIFLPESGFQ